MLSRNKRTLFAIGLHGILVAHDRHNADAAAVAKLASNGLRPGLSDCIVMSGTEWIWPGRRWLYPVERVTADGEQATESGSSISGRQASRARALEAPGD